MKKISSVLISASLIFLLFTPINHNVYAAERIKNTLMYTDVNKETPYYKEIVALNKSNILIGYSDGTYRPNKLITRKQAAAMIAKVVRKPAKEVYEKIEVLPGESLEVNRGQNKLLSEITPQELEQIKSKLSKEQYDEFIYAYTPHHDLTREQLAYSLLKTSNMQGIVTGKYPVFKDLKRSDYGYVAVVCLGRNGLNIKENTYYYPHKKVTRGEFASYLYVLKKYYNNFTPNDPYAEIKIPKTEGSYGGILIP